MSFHFSFLTILCLKLSPPVFEFGCRKRSSSAIAQNLDPNAFFAHMGLFWRVLKPVSTWWKTTIWKCMKVLKSGFGHKHKLWHGRCSHRDESLSASLSAFEKWIAACYRNNEESRVLSCFAKGPLVAVPTNHLLHFWKMESHNPWPCTLSACCP